MWVVGALVLAFGVGIVKLDGNLSVCLGECTTNTGCQMALESTDCGEKSVCCMDGFLSSTATGVDSETFSTEVPPEWQTEDYATASTVGSYIDLSSDKMDNLALGYEGSTEQYTTLSNPEISRCPGACIPTEQSSLCQFPLISEPLCAASETCCATEEAAARLEYFARATESPQTYMELECPGRCVDPSFAIFCDKILSNYNCPVDSKCCEINIAGSLEIRKADLKCPGECLQSRFSYFCLPPFQLVPGTDCRETTICCMRAEHELDLEGIGDLDSKLGLPEHFPESESPGSALAYDSTGQVYYVMQNGRFRPLDKISFEESLSPSYAHFTDIQFEDGRASLFRDSDNILYQLTIKDTKDYSSSSALNLNIPLDNDRSTVNYPKTVVSLPDESDDVEENFKDVILPEEGENLLEQDSIPPGERTLIKPHCPGTCVSPLLRFTCIRNSATYDGFTCPSKSVCCADINEIEKHEKYLRSLSPYFKAMVNLNTVETGCAMKKHEQKDSNEYKWCWQAAIINSRNQYMCSATIIDGSWILTAAHCVTGALRQDKELYVRAGVADLAKASDNTVGQTLRAMSIFVHPKHNSVSLDNDIALLRLQSPLKMTANVCSICLPAAGVPKENPKCIATSYGFRNRGGSMTLKIQEADALLVDDIDCITNFTDSLASVFILPASSFCAGGQDNSEMCQIDAGGSLICQTDDHHELIGLFSWGLGCQRDNVPNIYVKVPAFLTWINEIITANDFLKTI